MRGSRRLLCQLSASPCRGTQGTRFPMKSMAPLSGGAEDGITRTKSGVTSQPPPFPHRISSAFTPYEPGTSRGVAALSTTAPSLRLLDAWTQAAHTTEHELFFSGGNDHPRQASHLFCNLCGCTVVDGAASVPGTGDTGSAEVVVSSSRRSPAAGTDAWKERLSLQHHIGSPGHLMNHIMLEFLLHDVERWVATQPSPVEDPTGGIGVSPEQLLAFGHYLTHRWRDALGDSDAQADVIASPSSLSSLRDTVVAHVMNANRNSNTREEVRNAHASFQEMELPAFYASAPVTMEEALALCQESLHRVVEDRAARLRDCLDALRTVGVVQSGLLTHSNVPPHTSSQDTLLDLGGSLSRRKEAETALLPKDATNLTNAVFHRLECLGDVNWGDQCTRRLAARYPCLDWTGSPFGPFLMDAVRTRLESNVHLADVFARTGLAALLQIEAEVVDALSAKFKADVLEAIAGEIWVALWALEATPAQMSERVAVLRDPCSRLSLGNGAFYGLSPTAAARVARVVEATLALLYDLVVLVHWEAHFSACLRCVVSLARQRSAGVPVPASAALVSKPKPRKQSILGGLYAEEKVVRCFPAPLKTTNKHLS